MANRSGRLALWAMAAMAASSSWGQVLWYNGDYDGRRFFDALPSGRNLQFGDSRVYDNFHTNGNWVVQQVWGNYMITPDALNDSQGLYFEIRRGVSQGNGGTLVTGGSIAIISRIPTGRIGVDRENRQFEEWQIMGPTTGVTLANATEYWLTVAVIGRGRGLAFLSTTDGRDADPNPPPVGNIPGESFEDSSTFQLDYEDTSNLTGETTDASMGMMGAVPEPTSLAGLAAGLAFLARRRRKHAKGNQLP